jgi:hypothetical protein
MAPQETHFQWVSPRWRPRWAESAEVNSFRTREIALPAEQRGRNASLRLHEGWARVTTLMTWLRPWFGKMTGLERILPQ